MIFRLPRIPTRLTFCLAERLVEEQSLKEVNALQCLGHTCRDRLLLPCRTLPRRQHFGNTAQSCLLPQYRFEGRKNDIFDKNSLLQLSNTNEIRASLKEISTRRDRLVWAGVLIAAWPPQKIHLLDSVHNCVFASYGTYC